MSAIGSAKARGPEMWSDTASPQWLAGVVVEQHEPGLMDGRDRHVVVAGPVPRMVLQRPERFPQGIPVARPDPEEQAELARRADADARPGRSGCSCCHCFLP